MMISGTDNSFIQLRRAYYVPGNLPGARDTTVNTTQSQPPRYLHTGEDERQ